MNNNDVYKEYSFPNVDTVKIFYPDSGIAQKVKDELILPTFKGFNSGDIDDNMMITSEIELDRFTWVKFLIPLVTNIGLNDNSEKMLKRLIDEEQEDFMEFVEDLKNILSLCIKHIEMGLV